MEYLSVKQAATKWNVSERTITSYCKANKIDGCIKSGKFWLIPKTTVNPFKYKSPFELKSINDIINSNILLPNYESEDEEWKETWRDEYFEYVSGFSNSNGGLIFIGVNDKREFINLANWKDLLVTLPNKLNQLLGVVASVTDYTYETRKYIVIKVEKSLVPISYNGSYYKRSGSSNHKLNGLALQNFLLKNDFSQFEAKPCISATLSDISDLNVINFVKQGISKKRLPESLSQLSTKNILESISLIVDDKLTNAAILLFSNNPEKFISSAYIKLGYFDEFDKLQYEDVLYGSILNIIDQTISFLETKYLKKIQKINGIIRDEYYFPPETALREAITNALCHRNYQSNGCINIRVYSNRIIILNPGNIPDEIVSGKMIYLSNPTNMLISQAFSKIGLVENWGLGINKIYNSCLEKEFPLPKYNSGAGFVSLTFTKEKENFKLLVNKNVNELSKDEQLVYFIIKDNLGIEKESISNITSFSLQQVDSLIKKLEEKKFIYQDKAII